MLFVPVFVLSFPFGYHLLPDPGKYTARFFVSVAHGVASHILHAGPGFRTAIVSDSRAMYADLLVVALLSLLLAWPMSVLLRRKKVLSFDRVNRIFSVGCAYYLALQLLIYGFNKVFKAQFYLPEPNTLYTHIGDAPRDLLYWSTMGLSRSYSLFMGLAEVIPAGMLLFRRTRALGALILSGVLLNVVWVNFSFDISVKVYSLFLWLLSLAIAAPAYRLLFRFFIQEKPVAPAPRYVPPARRRWCYISLKTIALGLLLLESLWMYMASGNFNDDRAPRPELHGAWTVPYADSCVHEKGWQRVFIHRRGYFIVQDRQEQMKDYRLYYDSIPGRLVIENYENGAVYPLVYHRRGDSLFLEGIVETDTIALWLRAARLQDLPALQNDFHWFSDED